MMAIEKHTFELTVLVDSENRGVENVGDCGLEELTWLINTGPGIGSLSQVGVEEVPTARVPDELRAIGNDGTFFDHD